jgi:predicted RNase H-like HicB family nuclease
MPPHIKFNFNITLRPDSVAGVVVSYCSALGVYSQGENEAEAQQAIEEALGLYLETAFEHDRLDQVLRRAGFAQLSSISLEHAIQNQMEYVAVHQEKEIAIEVPLYLLAQQTKTAECLQ